MIEIDGSLGEGGGQVLRTSLALAAVLGKQVHIFNIRAKRSEPGLRAQHLTSVRALAQLCNASSQGLEVGSREFTFKPGKLAAGSFRFDVGTAGSITLVLQTLMPLLPFAPGNINLEIHGGTDVKWSPPIDYLQLVTVPMLAKMGVKSMVQLIRRGHYPKGGGIVKLSSSPFSPLRPINGVERGDVLEIKGVSHALRLPRHVAERQAEAAVKIVKAKGLALPNIEIDHSESQTQVGPGSGIVLCARTVNGGFLGGDSLGERGRLAEEVGSAAGKVLVDEIESNHFLDRHMGDMIVPYVALAEGVSDVSIAQVTQHTLTNVKVAELVADAEFDSLADVGEPSRLKANGLGWRREQDAVSARGPVLIQGP